MSSRHTALPITRDLTLAYTVSLLVAALMTITSVAGLLLGAAVLYDVDAKLLPAFVGQDALNLLVGLPLLLGSMWLTRRGSLIGLLLWPGALFYVLYDYGYYLLGAPYGVFFLPYIALMTVSAYAMVAIVVSIDAGAVRARIGQAIPNRLTGGFLAAVALLFSALWTAISVSMLISGVVEEVPRIVTIMDLTIQLPALFVGGVLLWRRQPIGYVVASGLLLQAAAYLAGLSAITILGADATGAPVTPMSYLPGIVVAAVALALLAFFVRGAAAGQRRETGPARREATGTAR